MVWSVADDIDEIFRRELAALLPRLRRAARAKAATYSDPDSTAEEILQDTCERAWEKRHQWSGENFVAWFLTIFDTRLAEEGKRRAKTPVFVDYQTSRTAMEQVDRNAEMAFEAIEHWDVLMTLRPHLTEGQWMAVRTIVVLDLDYAEAALILGMPVGTIKSRMHAVRRIAEEKLP